MPRGPSALPPRLVAAILLCLLIAPVASLIDQDGTFPIGLEPGREDRSDDGDSMSKRSLNFDATTSSSPPSSWRMQDAPVPNGGQMPTSWRPDPTGALWQLDFSPDGSRIATVDISTGHLIVWNVSDARILLWADHDRPLVDVAWLSEDSVLVADVDTEWSVWHVTDDYQPWPLNETTVQRGKWSGNLSGDRPGHLWGMDVSDDRSLVVFCGDINEPSIGGEIVVADAAHFRTGSAANSSSVFTTSMSIDCAFSPNGSMVAAIERRWDDVQQGNRDVVVGWMADEMDPLWTRNIGGSLATAWAIDWQPDGSSYTVAWNRPNEGVVSHFEHLDGSVRWYAPFPHDMSAVAWMPTMSHVIVGSHDPGRAILIDGTGVVENDVGWHSAPLGGIGQPADVLAIDVDSVNKRFASAGRDGTIEVWSINDGEAPRFIRRLGTNLVREIDTHPDRAAIVTAESGGIVTVWDIHRNIVEAQCQHPNFGEPVDDIPYAKSVRFANDGEVIAGFSDGIIIRCGMDGKSRWTIALSAHGDIEVFGRVEPHPMGGWIAVSWGEDANDTTKDGVVAIVDPLNGTVAKRWDYTDVHWTLAFSREGGRLSSIAQNGAVRMWDSSDPTPQTWSDLGSPYSHGNYTGANLWHDSMELLVTGGWDRSLKAYDPGQGLVLFNATARGEIFAVEFLSGGSRIAVASGEAGTSERGWVEVIDAATQTTLDSYEVDAIPRGLGELNTGEGLVVVNHTGSMQVLVPDLDGDGVMDGEDDFPDDPTQWSDSDDDGYGDEADGLRADACPDAAGDSDEDRYGCPDSDGDGFSDPDEAAAAHPNGSADAFPDDPSQHRDSDGDGHGDAYSFILDEQGLRNESGDAFPTLATQWHDRDGDGCGDEHSFEIDADGLRVNETGDAFPTDASQCTDLDGDGYGDSYSFTLDSDGLRIENGDLFPIDHLAWWDRDGDGCVPASATGLPFDLAPNDASRCSELLSFSLPTDVSMIVDQNGPEWSVRISWTGANAHTNGLRLLVLQHDGSGVFGDVSSAQSNQTGEGAAEAAAARTSSMTMVQDWLTSDPTDLTIPLSRDEGATTLTLALLAESHDGQLLERWWNATWIDGGSDREDGEDSDTDTDAAGDLDGGTGDSGSESSEGGVGLQIVIAIVTGLVLFAIAGIILVRRPARVEVESLDDAMESATALAALSTTELAPCATCGGDASAAEHAGARWSWCPKCRSWLEYLGPS